jgi:hypothetical protein
MFIPPGFPSAQREFMPIAAIVASSGTSGSFGSAFHHRSNR